MVGTGIHTSVADQDTVKNPFYFYIVSEEGESWLEVLKIFATVFTE